MALIGVQDLTFGYGSPPLLDGSAFQIETGERIGLLGRNGQGKSTLLKILAGEIDVEPGVIARQRGARVAMLGQEVPKDLEGSVYQVVSSGLGAKGELLRRHHELAERVTQDDSALGDLQQVQQELDAAHAWELQRDVDRALSKLSLDPDLKVGELSAGMTRRVLLARALVSEPELLLLDEPTNHLDVDAILWLEEFLLRHDATLLFVTHDRVFLEKVATRILELDRGQLRSWNCGYRQFLERREEVLAAEEKDWARQDKKLAEEEVWVRRGTRARRTRNEGRVRALEQLRSDRQARRERVGSMKAELDSGQKSGRLVIDAVDLTFAYEGIPIVEDFTMKIFRGDKIGLIGPNGVGKSTLLRLLLGKLEPQIGTVRHGTKLQIAYFDQLQDQLDESKSVIDNVREGGDYIEIGGRKRHIQSYLEDFLFSPDRIRGRLSSLSGGERNRLLLAKLFARPANVLVLDEPTNDLDIESLELLETLLVDYAGTLLIVSHDRAFLDDVATVSLIFEGSGRVREIVGGYGAWEKIRADQTARRKKAPAPAAKPKTPPKKKLSYNEQRELESLPVRIEELESEVAALHEKMAAPEFYQAGGAAMGEAKSALEHAETALTEVYERWEALEAKE